MRPGQIGIVSTIKNPVEAAAEGIDSGEDVGEGEVLVAGVQRGGGAHLGSVEVTRTVLARGAPACGAEEAEAAGGVDDGNPARFCGGGA